MFTKVQSMSLPDASSLSFPDDGSPCPQLSQIPELKAVSENEQVNFMCKSLGDRLTSVKAGVFLFFCFKILNSEIKQLCYTVLHCYVFCIALLL